MNPEVDQIRLNFSPEGLTLLNIILGLIMFGVALELKWEDFQRVSRQPKSSLMGMVSQFFLLPALTFGLVWALKPALASMALGMFLVAACPGGNMSNFISVMAKGNGALSVTLTAISTLAAIVLTPFNFQFWASFYPPAAEILTTIKLDAWDMFKSVATLLGIPLIAGMLVAKQFPALTKKLIRPMKWFSILAFIAFVLVALYQNGAFFREHIDKVFFIVLLHNALAFIGAYFFAKAVRLDETDARTVSIETGIQNSGLALVIIFTFFDGMGGMAIVAAFWGIWHLVAGLTLAWFWSRRTPPLHKPV
jgi:BASS family bile acid:Na+ symporter